MGLSPAFGGAAHPGGLHRGRGGGLAGAGSVFSTPLGGRLPATRSARLARTARGGSLVVASSGAVGLVLLERGQRLLRQHAGSLFFGSAARQAQGAAFGRALGWRHDAQGRADHNLARQTRACGRCRFSLRFIPPRTTRPTSPRAAGTSRWWNGPAVSLVKRRAGCRAAPRRWSRTAATPLSDCWRGASGSHLQHQARSSRSILQEP